MFAFKENSVPLPLESQVRPYILGIGGTSRVGSTSEKALRLTLDAAERLGADVELFSGPLLDLPMYDPTDTRRTLAAQRLVERMRRADGIVVASPSYHGALSGMIKNALDYTEDMARDAQPYFDGRPVGLIVTAYGPQALGVTLSGLRGIVHALRGWPTPLGVTLNSTLYPLVDGEAAPKEVQAQFESLAQQVVTMALMKKEAGLMR